MTNVTINENMLAAMGQIANLRGWADNEILPNLIESERKRIKAEVSLINLRNALPPSAINKKPLVVEGKDLRFSKLTGGSFTGKTLQKKSWKRIVPEIIDIIHNKKLVEDGEIKNFLVGKRFIPGLTKQKGKLPIDRLGLSAPSSRAPEIGSLIQELSESFGNIPFEINFIWRGKKCPLERLDRSGVFRSA